MPCHRYLRFVFNRVVPFCDFCIVCQSLSFFLALFCAQKVRHCGTATTQSTRVLKTNFGTRVNMRTRGTTHGFQVAVPEGKREQNAGQRVGRVQVRVAW